MARSTLRLAGLLLLHCITTAPIMASATVQSIGAAQQTLRRPDGVELVASSGARLRVAFVAPDVVRVRLAPDGGFGPESSYAVAAPTAAPTAVVAEDGADSLVLSGGADGARVRIALRPQVAVTVLDADGNEIVADDPERPMAFDSGGGAVEVSKRRPPDELYYGFGEKALPQSRHEQFMAMWNTDAPKYAPGLDPLYQDIPFFIALRGGRCYGIFFDNTWRSWFDMGKSDPRRYAFGASGGELDYYVFSGGRARSPKQVLRAYAALTGRMPLPPLWALGYQQSRYSYTPAARVREIAHGFRERHIPVDVVYLDIDYMDGFRIFTWSPTAFAEPDRLLAELRDLSIKPVTIVDPGIKVDEDWAIYRDGRSRGVYVRDAAGGELHARVWPGICAFPDFTEPAARAWFGSLYAKFLDQGVAGFWNDMDEPATFAAPDPDRPVLSHDARKTFPLDARHAGDGQPGTHARYHNVYGMQMARATFDGLRTLRPRQRPFVLTRAGYAGVQRYAAVWTGDNVASWEHLALTIPMLTGLSVSGVPFVGADIGGYAGSPDGELYARWLQAAVLTPFFRTHAETGSADREPWSFGPDFERINRATIELRYRLLPYLYTQFAAAERDGDPIMRPLWFDHVGDSRTWLADDEFLAGPDLLVAPVLRVGARSRVVYFPRGADWIDWWSGERHAGGSSAEIAAPLDRLPLFARAGAVIPVAPVAQHTGETVRAPVTLVAAVGTGSGDLYQDAGDGYDYRSGGSATTFIGQREGALDLRRSGGGHHPGIAAIEWLGVQDPPSDVRVDGRRTEAVFDAVTRRARAALSGAQPRQVRWQGGSR